MAHDKRFESIEDELAYLRSGKKSNTPHNHQTEKDTYINTANELYDKHNKNLENMDKAHEENKKIVTQDLINRGYDKDPDVIQKTMNNLDIKHKRAKENKTMENNSAMEAERRKLGVSKYHTINKSELKQFGTKELQHARMAGYGIGGALAAYTLYKFLQSRNKDDDEQ